jgi:hypothetical protein
MAGKRLFEATATSLIRQLRQRGSGARVTGDFRHAPLRGIAMPVFNHASVRRGAVTE